MLELYTLVAGTVGNPSVMLTYPNSVFVNTVISFHKEVEKRCGLLHLKISQSPVCFL